MITAYLMIGSFVFGAYCAAAYEREENLPATDWVLIAFLSIAWPILIPMLVIYLARRP